MISQKDLKEKLQQLVLYAQKNLSLKDADVFYTQNTLLDLFKLDAPADPATSYPDNFPEEVLDKIVQYAVEHPEKHFCADEYTDSDGDFLSCFFLKDDEDGYPIWELNGIK